MESTHDFYDHRDDIHNKERKSVEYCGKDFEERFISISDKSTLQTAFDTGSVDVKELTARLIAHNIEGYDGDKRVLFYDENRRDSYLTQIGNKAMRNSGDHRLEPYIEKEANLKYSTEVMRNIISSRLDTLLGVEYANDDSHHRRGKAFSL